MRFNERISKLFFPTLNDFICNFNDKSFNFWRQTFGKKKLEFEFSCNNHHFQKGTSFELLSILFAILIYARIRIFLAIFALKNKRSPNEFRTFVVNFSCFSFLNFEVSVLNLQRKSFSLPKCLSKVVLIWVRTCGCSQLGLSAEGGLAVDSDAPSGKMCSSSGRI